jgi:hypothetical protein
MGSTQRVTDKMKGGCPQGEENQTLLSPHGERIKVRGGVIITQSVRDYE